jgi:methionyl-tRNA formyltransferase
MLQWAFLGAKEQGKLILQTLARDGYKPAIIITLADLPSHEIDEFQALAKKMGCDFALDTEIKQHISFLKQMDMFLVCRFSLLPEAIFALPRLGSVNVHNSLLPSYRGVHPVQWALVNGEPKTGVTIHCIDAGIDTGAILLQKPLSIKQTHNTGTLTHDLNLLSADLCSELFNYIAAHNALPPAKDSPYPSSYARRRTRNDSRINWNSNAEAICNLVRAMQPPMPLAFSFAPDGSTLLIESCVKLETQNDGAAGTVIKCLQDGQYWIACKAGAVCIRTSATLASGTKLT